MQNRSFNAKILLFGEYTIINSSHALAIPIDHFSGKLVYGKFSPINDLSSFAEYLDELKKHGDLLSGLDVSMFKHEIGIGLYFESNIPQGYGAGSSGALCAAVYERFSNEKKEAPNSTNLSNLRKILAQMENFFHGSSSGIDPLISLINQPILIESNQNQIIQLPSSKNSGGAIFLLDTGIERKTEPLVKIFLEKYKEDHFAKACQNQLTLYNENAIRNFIEGRWEDLLKNVQLISTFQSKHFEEMIPKDFISIWKNGLYDDLYKLKLCGAGGGGFILGFTKDYEKTKLTISSINLIPIFRF